MQAQQHSVFAHRTHQIVKGAVVDLEPLLFIDHVSLERTDARLQQGRNFCQGGFVDVRRNHMQRIVCCDMPVRLNAAMFQAIEQAVTMALQSEIDDRGGATAQSGDGAGIKVVNTLLAHEANQEVHMGIDTARQHDPVARINDALAPTAPWRDKVNDFSIVDDNVCRVRSVWAHHHAAGYHEIVAHTFFKA